MNALNAKVQEQDDIIQDKHNKLDAIRLELNKATKHETELKEHLVAAQERSRILENMLEDNEPSYKSIVAKEVTKYDTFKIDNTNIFIFGGSSNWQNAASAVIPALIYIPVTDKDFNLKRIYRADVIIFKTTT